MKILKKRSDFIALRQGERFGAPGFLLVRRRLAPDAVDGGRVGARIGFTVTKKLGGAVVRNRIKRRLKAVAREVFPGLAEADCDYVLIARSAARTREFADLLDDMRRALLSLPANPK